ncbi:MAG: N-formylglutamate amidohydrolase [Promethearchaeota archaeon]
MNLKKYIESRIGYVPIILSCPHGGFLKPTHIPNKLVGTQLADKNKYLITKKILKELQKNEIRPYYILSKIHRSKVDFNRPARAYDAFNHRSVEAKEIHQSYHFTLENFYKDCISNYNRCLIIDLHGFTKPHRDYPDIIFGNIFGKTLNIANDSGIPDSNGYWVFSDMVRELSKHFTLDDGLGITDFNLAYSGGYITHQFYKKDNVNAFQLEVAKYIRENVKLTNIFINTFVSVIINCLKE